MLTYILTFSRLTRTNRHVFFSHPTHAYSSKEKFYSPCCARFRPTCPHGRFLSIIISHTGLLIYKDVLFPLPRPIKASPSTSTFSFHWHSPHSLTRPHRRFLSYTIQLVYKDILFTLTQPTQTYSSTQTFFSPQRTQFCPRGVSIFNLI